MTSAEIFANAVRAIVASLPPEGTCLKCDADCAVDYPVCAPCAHMIHFTHRACLCDACAEERADDVRVFGDDVPLLADILDERIAA
jgi:predicted amidophosphoribosyltransferase